LGEEGRDEVFECDEGVLNLLLLGLLLLLLLVLVLVLSCFIWVDYFHLFQLTKHTKYLQQCQIFAYVLKIVAFELEVGRLGICAGVVFIRGEACGEVLLADGVAGLDVEAERWIHGGQIVLVEDAEHAVHLLLREVELLPLLS
jgi:hypothetical protein